MALRLNGTSLTDDAGFNYDLKDQFLRNYGADQNFASGITSPGSGDYLYNQANRAYRDYLGQNKLNAFGQGGQVPLQTPEFDALAPQIRGLDWNSWLGGKSQADWAKVYGYNVPIPLAAPNPVTTPTPSVFDKPRAPGAIVDPFGRQYLPGGGAAGTGVGPLVNNPATPGATNLLSDSLTDTNLLEMGFTQVTPGTWRDSQGNVWARNTVGPATPPPATPAATAPPRIPNRFGDQGGAAQPPVTPPATPPAAGAAPPGKGAFSPGDIAGADWWQNPDGSYQRRAPGTSKLENWTNGAWVDATAGAATPPATTPATTPPDTLPRIPNRFGDQGGAPPPVTTPPPATPPVTPPPTAPPATPPATTPPPGETTPDRDAARQYYELLRQQGQSDADARAAVARKFGPAALPGDTTTTPPGGAPDEPPETERNGAWKQANGWYRVGPKGNRQVWENGRWTDAGNPPVPGTGGPGDTTTPPGDGVTPPGDAKTPRYPYPTKPYDPEAWKTNPAFLSRLKDSEQRLRDALDAAGRTSGTAGENAFSENARRLGGEFEGDAYNRWVAETDKQYARALTEDEQTWGRDWNTNERFYQRLAAMIELGYRATAASASLGAGVSQQVADILARAGVGGSNNAIGQGANQGNFYNYLGNLGLNLGANINKSRT